MSNSYSRWFDESLEKQEQVLLNYLPSGRIYKKAYLADTNFNKVIKWLAKSFYRLVFTYNRTFKGLFICESRYLLEKFKIDYNIPNNIFFEADEYTHVRDIYVLKYLMKGNTDWHFRAIANIYGVKVKVLANYLIHFERLDFSHESNPIEAEARYLKIVNKLLNIYDIITPVHVSVSHEIVDDTYEDLIHFDCESFNIDPSELIGAIETFRVDINHEAGMVGEVCMDKTETIDGYTMLADTTQVINSSNVGELTYEGGNE